LLLFDVDFENVGTYIGRRHPKFAPTTLFSDVPTLFSDVPTLDSETPTLDSDVPTLDNTWVTQVFFEILFLKVATSCQWLTSV
jgi:hypothetical protein